MNIHVYLHDDNNGVERRLEALCELLSTLMVQITNQGHNIMVTMQDVQAKVVELTAKVARETDLDTSIIVLVQGLGAVVAGLKQQLADAIASNDPVALQAVVDGLSSAEATMDENAAKLASAVAANLPPA